MVGVVANFFDTRNRFICYILRNFKIRGSIKDIYIPELQTLRHSPCTSRGILFDLLDIDTLTLVSMLVAAVPRCICELICYKVGSPRFVSECVGLLT